METGGGFFFGSAECRFLSGVQVQGFTSAAYSTVRSRGKNCPGPELLNNLPGKEEKIVSGPVSSTKREREEKKLHC